MKKYTVVHSCVCVTIGYRLIADEKKWCILVEAVLAEECRPRQVIGTN